MPPIRVKYRTLVRVGVAAYFVQGVAMTMLVLNSDKIIKQGKYLASIVEKNVENLDEFDIIALRELGIIKAVENS